MSDRTLNTRRLSPSKEKSMQIFRILSLSLLPFPLSYDIYQKFSDLISFAICDFIPRKVNITLSLVSIWSQGVAKSRNESQWVAASRKELQFLWPKEVVSIRKESQRVAIIATWTECKLAPNLHWKLAWKMAANYEEFLTLASNYIVVALLHRVRERQVRRKPRFWVRKFLRLRERYGAFHTLVQELRIHDREYFFRWEKA